MRSREEIESGVGSHHSATQFARNVVVIVELLLDIRDLLDNRLKKM